MHSACLRFSAHSTVCLCEGLNICEELAIYLIGPNGFSHITLYERPTTRVGITLSERVACHEYEADIPLCERITTISGITLSGRVNVSQLYQA